MRNDKSKNDKSLTKYFVKVYGCQYNEWDGARLDFVLQKLGLILSSEKEADVIFLLSCSVRKSAVDRVMSLVKNNAHKKVVVTGCVLENDKPKYIKKNVILWDINKPEKLALLLFETKGKTAENFSLHSKNIKSILSGDNTSSAYLPIMTGCNNFCAYCVVPYVRGREKSKPFDEIVSDFKNLVKADQKEIILLGQNVNSYSAVIPVKTGIQKDTILDPRVKPEDDKAPFAQLLETLNNISGDFKIGFTSSHPKDMTDDIIAAVRDLKKIKKEIHLPLQSGSNKILKAMNRPYTKEKYLKIAEKIKKEIPDIKLSTDVIVGFPGESEKDFQETVDLFKKINFSQAFVNKFSPRVGTAAFKLDDPISWAEKQRRWKVLDKIANKKKKDN